MSKAAELAALIGSQTALSNRNLIINGAMQVAQRGTSSTSVTSTGYHSCDRFKFVYTDAGTWTVSQSTDAPDGFANSFKVECTAAKSSLASDSRLLIIHHFEGQNLQQLKKGTSYAESLTLSFYVRTNKTGTYQVNLEDNDNIRIIGTTYTVSSANTWQKVTATFAGDTSGVLDDDNGDSFAIHFALVAGTDNSSGAVPTSWEAKSNTDRGAGLTVNLADATSNYWQITGVQLEVGEQATPFEHRSYGDELARCRRYYRQIGPSAASTAMPLLNGLTFASSQFQGTYHCEDMRSQPTLFTSGTASDYEVYSTTGRTATAVPSLDAQSEPFALDIRCDISGATAGQGAWLRTKNTSAYLGFDAEL